jgi:asparagine synthase (glutamine-hydrolysing)
MEVFSLPKKGFEIPIASWLTGPLKDLTLRSIDKDLLAKQNIFNSDLPRKWYEDLKENRVDTSEKLWTLIAFQAWCENFYPSWAI